MSNFFDKFPKVPYNISGERLGNYQAVTNIMFRFGFLRDVINNTSAYESYTIQEGDTPEILAHKYYGSPETYWLILYANDIYDPQYDWPLDRRSFDNYIEGKYGSTANAHAQIHHYEKIVGRQVENTEEFFFDKYEVDYTPVTITIVDVATYTGALDAGDIVYQSADLTYENASFTGEIVNFSGSNNVMFLANTVGNYLVDLPTYNYTKAGSPASNVAPLGFTSTDIIYPDPDVPHDFYVNLPATPLSTDYTLDGKTITEVIGRRAVSCYDYENERNESKRNIKLIHKQYLGPIMTEFGKITGSAPSYLRRLK